MNWTDSSQWGAGGMSININNDINVDLTNGRTAAAQPQIESTTE